MKSQVIGCVWKAEGGHLGLPLWLRIWVWLSIVALWACQAHQVHQSKENGLSYIRLIQFQPQ